VKTKTIKYKTALRRLGVFTYVEKLCNKPEGGLYQINFFNGWMWQFKGEILAVYLDDTLYVHPDYNGKELPKEFRKHAWCFDPSDDPEFKRGVLEWDSIFVGVSS